ncbi:hypothetical protein K440DRAFT_621025 [Wilcoxina mikolae CBS 423.85]|nr:hypothetical protein K440DRAFT_621025 [Wilcoxina mikolae CBS 423.85]
MALSTRSSSPTVELTSSSFLGQPVEDLLLLHSLNTLLASVSLPSLRNILDATPNLLIILYEALPRQARRRKRVPFVNRGNANGGYGGRLKNMKLLVGSIVHDEELRLRRSTTRRLVELDLAGFCEKDLEATRAVLDVFVEIAGKSAPEENEYGDSPSAKPPLAPTLRDIEDALRETRPESVATSLLEEISISVGSMLAQPAPASLATATLNSEEEDETPVKTRIDSGFLDVEDDADYGSSSEETSWSLQRYRRRHMRTRVKGPPPPPPLPPSRCVSPTEASDFYNENDVSLLPLPPSPPSQTRYLNLKGSDYFFKRSNSTQASASSKTTLRRERSKPVMEHTPLKAVMPNQEPLTRVPLSNECNLAVTPAEDCENPEQLLNSDDDHTSLVSVSPASWSSDSLYTAALRKKRAEALQRLRLAEKRFQDQVDARKDPAIDTVAADDRTEDEHENWDAILGYDDVEEELELVEEDGTVQVEKLEELVKAVLVRRGYKVIGEPEP